MSNNESSDTDLDKTLAPMAELYRHDDLPPEQLNSRIMEAARQRTPVQATQNRKKNSARTWAPGLATAAVLVLSVSVYWQSPEDAALSFEPGQQIEQQGQRFPREMDDAPSATKPVSPASATTYEDREPEQSSEALREEGPLLERSILESTRLESTVLEPTILEGISLQNSRSEERQSTATPAPRTQALKQRTTRPVERTTQAEESLRKSVENDAETNDIPTNSVTPESVTPENVATENVAPDIPMDSAAQPPSVIEEIVVTGARVADPAPRLGQQSLDAELIAAPTIKMLNDQQAIASHPQCDDWRLPNTTRRATSAENEAAEPSAAGTLRVRVDATNSWHDLSCEAGAWHVDPPFDSSPRLDP